MISDVEQFFFLIYLLVSIYLLWKSVYFHVFDHFVIGLFILILGCLNIWYILGINLLSIIPFANIFSHSEGCLSVLLMVSFAEQKL